VDTAVKNVIEYRIKQHLVAHCVCLSVLSFTGASWDARNCEFKVRLMQCSHWPICWPTNQPDQNFVRR